MSSSQAPIDHRKLSRRKFTHEEKQAVLDAYTTANAKEKITINDWCAQQGINTSQFYQWRKKFKDARKNAVRRARNPVPDHERDIEALAMLNAAPVPARRNGNGHAIPLPTTGNEDVDERVGRVIGTAMAEFFRRMRQ